VFTQYTYPSLANPTRLADDYSTEASTSDTTTQPTSANGHTNGKVADKKINFSISSHLQSDNKNKVVRKSSNPNDISAVTYQNAQKAYQTLMSNLKQQEALMKSIGFGNNSAAALFMNPFFTANMPSFDFFSAYQHATPKKRHKLGAYFKT
jgi:hypothetical protein